MYGIYLLNYSLTHAVPDNLRPLFFVFKQEKSPLLYTNFVFSMFFVLNVFAIFKW